MSKFRQGAIGVLMVSALSGGAIAAPCGEPIQTRAPIVQGAPLTLAAVFAQISQASPDIRRTALELKARNAEIDQAGRRPNPVVGFEIENFAGSGSLSGVDQSETTLSFQQVFELGKKRRKRRDTASASFALAQAECNVVLRQAYLGAARVFYELNAEIDLAELAERQTALANSLVETVSKRVSAGAAAPPELARVRSDAIALQATGVKLRSDVEVSRYKLAAFWGSAAPDFGMPDVPRTRLGDRELGLLTELQNHPALAFADAQVDLRQAEQLLAKSQVMPDVTLSAGVRRFQGSKDNALLFGVSVPFPIFNRNRDAAKAAGFRRDAQILNRATVQTQLETQHMTARLKRDAAQTRFNLLESKALKDAASAYDATVRGYQAGKFDLTTTLDARKGLIDAELAVINAARDFNIEDMTLRSLTGSAPFTGDAP